MVKTIAISIDTYKELIELKKEFKSPSLNDMLQKLILEYKEMLKRASIKQLYILNKTEKKTDIKAFLKDRVEYGWQRKSY